MAHQVHVGKYFLIFLFSVTLNFFFASFRFYSFILLFSANLKKSLHGINGPLYFAAFVLTPSETVTWKYLESMELLPNGNLHIKTDFALSVAYTVPVQNYHSQPCCSANFSLCA